MPTSAARPPNLVAILGDLDHFFCGMQCREGGGSAGKVDREGSEDGRLPTLGPAKSQIPLTSSLSREFVASFVFPSSGINLSQKNVSNALRRRRHPPSWIRQLCRPARKSLWVGAGRRKGGRVSEMHARAPDLARRSPERGVRARASETLTERALPGASHQEQGRQDPRDLLRRVRVRQALPQPQSRYALGPRTSMRKTGSPLLVSRPMTLCMHACAGAGLGPSNRGER
jgi:hypothetical protein